jgi:hypothetical protein
MPALAVLVLASCGSGVDSTVTVQVEAPPTVTAPTGEPAAGSTQSTAKKPKPEAATTTTQGQETGGATHPHSNPTASQALSPCGQKEQTLIRKIQAVGPGSPRGRKLSRRLHELTRTECGTHSAGSTQEPTPPTTHRR